MKGKPPFRWSLSLLLLLLLLLSLVLHCPPRGARTLCRTGSFPVR